MMARIKYKQLLCVVASLLLLSCECPFKEEREKYTAQSDSFYADVLIGTWQCYYPMIIGGVEYKQIVFMSNGKADITMAQQRDTDWYTETYSYAYYGSTLRFSKGMNNISLHIDSFLFPELYLSDSFGRYTMAKRR